ncbi:MAG: AAA family ATPase, partial [Chitinivibrionales bacterium]|nr:AAA family ATPase [Chitinivibrionales bacterium]
MPSFEDLYQILSQIASSQDNDVYIVKERQSGVSFLLKSPKLGADSQTERVNRKIHFQREIDMLSAFEHEHIARPCGSVFDDEMCAILYPFHEGKTLATALDKKESISPTEAFTIAIQLLGALEYIHNRGVIHNDINPQNIYLSEAKGVELIDFGLSMTEDEARGLPEGTIAGTLPWVAPEQIGITGFKIDRRSDLYCVGLILYRLLAGSLPFKLKSIDIAELLNATLRSDISPIKSAAALANSILLKSLKPTPIERYQTASGFRYDLCIANASEKGTRPEFFITGEKDAINAINTTRIFAGRETELEILERSFRKFEKGNPVSILLYGKSGTGKSELAREFKSSVNTVKNVFVAVKCNRFTPGQPYSIYRQILLEIIDKLASANAHLRSGVVEMLNSTMSENSGILCKIVPELKSLFREVKEIDEIEKEKEADRFIYILAELLIHLSKSFPLIVYIDDIQWIDEISFRIIHGLLKGNTRFLGLFSFRTADTSDEMYVSGNNLRKLSFSEIFKLSAFNKTDLQNLLDMRFGRIQNRNELACALYQRASGNPFIVQEGIHYLVNNGYLTITEKGWEFDLNSVDELPERFDIISLILRKIQLLNEDEINILQICSLIEGKIIPDIIEKVTELSSSVQHSCMMKLEDQGFLIPQLQGGYLFIHDKVRESICAGITNVKKLKAYEKLGEVYYSCIRQDYNHIFHAAECMMKSSNLHRAIKICYQAAKIAKGKIAFETAIKYYKNALLLLKNCPDKGIANHYNIENINIEFADLLSLIGKNENALRIFQDICKLNTFKNDAQILAKIGTIYYKMGEFSSSVEYFKKSLKLSNVKFSKNATIISLFCACNSIKILAYSIMPRLAFMRRTIAKTQLDNIQILNTMASAIYFKNNLESMYFHLKALDLAYFSEDSFSKATAFANHGFGAFHINFKRSALSHADMSIQCAQTIQRKDALAYCKNYLGLVYYFNAEWGKSLHALNQSLNEYHSIGYKSGTLLVLKHIYKNYLMKGDLFHAKSFAIKTLDQCRSVQEKYFNSVTLAASYFFEFIANLSISGNKEEKIRNLLSETDSYLFHIEAGSYLLRVEILSDKIVDAYDRSKHLIALTKKHTMNCEYTIPVFALHCEALEREFRKRLDGNQCLLLSNKELLSEHVKSVISIYLLSLTYLAYKGIYRKHLGALFAMLKLYGLAKFFYKKAIKKCHSIDMKYEEAQCIRDYAIFLDELCKKPGDARDQYNKAYKLFAQCGARFETERIKDKVDKDVIYEVNRIFFNERVEAGAKESTYTSTTANGVNQIRFESISDISNLVTHMDNTPELLKKMLMSLISSTGAQFGCFFIEGDENHEKKSLFMNFDGKELIGKQVKWSFKVVEQVKATRETVLLQKGVVELGESSKDTRYIRSVLCVPLARNDNYLGCVYLGNNNVADLFSDGSKKTAQILAAQAGILLENAYLMDNYKRLNRNLQQRVREQTEDIRDKNTQLEETNIRIVESERMKGLLTNTIVHDIKNYIAGIQGSIGMLGRRVADDQKMDKLVNLATAGCSDIVSLSSNLLDIARMDDGKLVLKRSVLELGRILQLMDKFMQNPLFEEKDISVTVTPPDGDYDVYADAYLLERIFQNLFSNAAKYVPNGGNVEITFANADNERI